MRSQLGLESHVTSRRGARVRPMPVDPWRVEARRAQTDAIAEGVHWVRTNARRTVEHLMNGKPRADRPAPNGIDSLRSFAAGRYSLNFVIAGAISRGVLRLVELVRRSILEPYARRCPRKIAIDGLKALDDRLLADIGLRRSEIELAVDGGLPPRGDRLSPRVPRHPPREEWRHELPRAA